MWQDDSEEFIQTEIFSYYEKDHFINNMSIYISVCFDETITDQ